MSDHAVPTPHQGENNREPHPRQPQGPPTPKGDASTTDDYTWKRLLAIDVLLEEPEEISDGLEVELYALRDKLQAAVLGW